MGVLEKVNERRTSDHALNDAANIRHELKAEIVDSESCISPKAENLAPTFHSSDPLTSSPHDHSPRINSLGRQLVK